MDSESRRFRREERLAPEALPVELAQKFVEGTLLEGIESKTKKDKSQIYPLYEVATSIPEVDNIHLYVDWREYHQPSPERPHQLRFEYSQVNPTSPKEHKLVAQMYLGVMGADTFVLEHRYVDPAFRTRSGIGTQLLQTTEGWVQQVADQAHRPMTLRLKTGQESVIKWIQKMGYSVSDDQRTLLEELDSHPERFSQDEVFVSSESRDSGVVKDSYTFRVGTESRYMEDAIRLTFSKVIQDRQNP